MMIFAAIRLLLKISKAGKQQTSPRAPGEAFLGIPSVSIGVTGTFTAVFQSLAPKAGSMLKTVM